MELGENNQIVEPVIPPEADPVTPPVNEKPFKVFKTQKEFDDHSASIRKSSEKRNKSDSEVEAFFKAKFEEESKMSDAEKISVDRIKLETEMKEAYTNLNKTTAEAMLIKAGVKNLEIYTVLVTDNKESLKTIENLCAELESRGQSVLDSMNANSRSIKNGNNEKGDKSGSYAQRIANSSPKTKNDIKNNYR